MQSTSSHSHQHPTSSHSHTNTTTQNTQQHNNFRQAGTYKQSDGRLFLGAAHSYHTALTSTINRQSASSPSLQTTTQPITSVSSIPSRYETVLYSGDQEVEGFESRTVRFKSEVVSNGKQ